MFSVQLLPYLAILALSPALFWMYLYYRRDCIEPEPKVLIFKTFIYGMLAASPLLVLKFINLAFPQASLFAVTHNLITNSTLAAIAFYTIVAYVEEYLKHVGMVALVEKHRSEFDQIVDGIEYAVASALGFVFIENIVYFYGAYTDLGLSSQFLLIFALRALLSTLAHTVFSGYFGYLYARAKMDSQISAQDKDELTHLNSHLLHGAWKLHTFRTHIVPHRASQNKHNSALLIAEGFFVAVLLHSIYNLLLSLDFGTHNFAYLNVPFIFFAAYYLFSQFQVAANHKIVKAPGRFVYGFLCWPEKRKFLKAGHTLEEWKDLFFKDTD